MTYTNFPFIKVPMAGLGMIVLTHVYLCRRDIAIDLLRMLSTYL